MTNEELAAAIQTGDDGKVLPLWEQTKRFVYRMAARYIQLVGLDAQMYEDLCQAGFLAMIGAAGTYDGASEAGFLKWLSFYLKTEFRKAMGITTEREAKDPIHRAMSLDAPASDDEGSVYEMIQAPDCWQEVDDRIWREQARKIIQEMLDQLPRLQSDVLIKRYYQGRSVKEIAASLGVRSEDVRALEEKAMRVLRNGRISARLRELAADDLAPCYTKVGPRRFNTTSISSVEVAVFERERMRNVCV